MKKFYSSLLAIAAIAFASCSSEEPATNPAAGQEGEVTFSITMPGAMPSRSIADGLSAVDLTYVVFDGTDPIIQKTEAAAFVGKTATVKISLVNGKTYKVAFVATSPDAPYTIADGKLAMNYGTAKDANLDAYDAFYKVEEIEVEAGMPQRNIVLTRPFAQVNVGASDWTDAHLAGYDVTTTKLTYSASVYTEMNLIDGSVAGNPEVVEFDYKPLPDFDAATSTPATLTVAGNPYHYVAMTYVLVPAAAKTVNQVNFMYQGPNSREFTIPVNQVPVQRNHRTNIVGKFFTTDVEYKIIIDETFDADDFNMITTPVTAASFSGLSAGDQFNLPSTTVTMSSDVQVPEGVSVVGQGAAVSTLVVDATDTGRGLLVQNAGVSFSDLTIDGTDVPTANYSSAINIKADGCSINNSVIKGGGNTTWSSSILVEQLKPGDEFHINGSEVYGAFRGLLAESQQGDIYVDNCVLAPQCYTLNIDGGGNFGLYVTNTTLQGWTSYSSMTNGAHFTGCKFMKSTRSDTYGYNTVVSYCTSTFTDCEFSADIVFYAGNPGAGYTVTFKNCTIGGVKVTAENLKSLLVTDPDSDLWNKCVCIVDGVTVEKD